MSIIQVFAIAKKNRPRAKLTQPNRRTPPSGGVANDFKLGRAVGTSEQGIDPRHSAGRRDTGPRSPLEKS
jgi:hypothetical protein